MLAFGFSLNLLTLLGLVLAIGIVVDDAIVVVEAVEHHMAEGLARRDATIKAISEVAGPIVAITTVLSCVLHPHSVPPWFDRFLLPAIRLDDRLLDHPLDGDSLTLSPAMCALFLQSPKERKDFLGASPGRRIGLVLPTFQSHLRGL